MVGLVTGEVDEGVAVAKIQNKQSIKRRTRERVKTFHTIQEMFMKHQQNIRSV